MSIVQWSVTDIQVIDNDFTISQWVQYGSNQAFHCASIHSLLLHSSLLYPCLHISFWVNIQGYVTDINDFTFRHSHLQMPSHSPPEGSRGEKRESPSLTPNSQEIIGQLQKRRRLSDPKIAHVPKPSSSHGGLWVYVQSWSITDIHNTGSYICSM